MNVRVMFFGVLVEKTGKSNFEIDSPGSLEDLKKKILSEYPGIKGLKYQVSVNRDIVQGNRELNDGDEIAFLPPFAGG